MQLNKNLRRFKLNDLSIKMQTANAFHENSRFPK